MGGGRHRRVQAREMVDFLFGVISNSKSELLQHNTIQARGHQAVQEPGMVDFAYDIFSTWYMVS